MLRSARLERCADRSTKTERTSAQALDGGSVCERVYVRAGGAGRADRATKPSSGLGRSGSARAPRACGCGRLSSDISTRRLSARSCASLYLCEREPTAAQCEHTVYLRTLTASVRMSAAPSACRELLSLDSRGRPSPTDRASPTGSAHCTSAEPVSRAPRAVVRVATIGLGRTRLHGRDAVAGCGVVPRARVSPILHPA